MEFNWISCSFNKTFWTYQDKRPRTHQSIYLLLVCLGKSVEQPQRYHHYYRVQFIFNFNLVRPTNGCPSSITFKSLTVNNLYLVDRWFKQMPTTARPKDISFCFQKNNDKGYGHRTWQKNFLNRRKARAWKRGIDKQPLFPPFRKGGKASAH